MIRIEPVDILISQDLAAFTDVATAVYKDDPVWINENLTGVVVKLVTALAKNKVTYTSFVGYVDDQPCARAIAIIPASSGESPTSTGWIGMFEVSKEQLLCGGMVLAACEEFFHKHNITTVIGPKVDSRQVGLLVQGFDLPQTILTNHNPPYYLECWLAQGYYVQQRQLCYTFTKSRAGHLRFSVPGIRIRSLCRECMAEEIIKFNAIQTAVFQSSPGYTTRTIAEDQELVESVLPFLDDDLVLFAETNKGETVGVVICLPDVYQSLQGKRIDRARIISIGAIPAYQRRGVGVALISQLTKNLVNKGYLTVEASWILATNHPPHNLAKRFCAQPGREFVLLRKEIGQANSANLQ